MAKAERLRRLVAETKRTADQAQKSFLKAEDRLAEVEERERRRAERRIH